MSTPMIHWVPIAEFMAMQAMEDVYARRGAALGARDLAGFERLLASAYRWIDLDGNVSDRAKALQDVETLFAAADGPISFRARLISVTASDCEMKVRAVKNLQAGDT